MGSSHGSGFVPPSYPQQTEQHLYRILRPDENPEGIVAKDPDAQKSVLSHVNCGGRDGYKSQYISASNSLEGIENYMKKGTANGLTGLRIGQFNVSKFPESCQMIDLSKTERRNEYLGDAVCKNYAKASREVLLQCNVPIPCTVIYPPPNGSNW